MNILILTKYRSEIDCHNFSSSLDYLKKDNFFYSYYLAFRHLKNNVYVDANVSFFFPIYLIFRFNFIRKKYPRILRILALNYIDNFLLSIKIGIKCKLKSIDLLFTEINEYISPKIIKVISPKTKVTQWYGNSPSMTSMQMLKILPQYDFLFVPGEFDRSKVHFNGIEKTKYIGPSVDKSIFYHDFYKDYSFDIVFVGGIEHFHSERIPILEAVAKRYKRFAFYGYGETSLSANSSLKKAFKGRASTTQIRKLYSSSKIAINIPLNNYEIFSKGFNERLFEIAACNGALQVIKFDKKALDFFSLDSIDFFFDLNNLFQVLDYYLLNEEERILKVRNSFRIVKKYNYVNKGKKILNYVK